MEKWFRPCVGDQRAHMALAHERSVSGGPSRLRGRDANEIERARISMMARNINVPSRAGYRSARPITPNHHFWLATHGRSIQKGHKATLRHYFFLAKADT